MKMLPLAAALLLVSVAASAAGPGKPEALALTVDDASIQWGPCPPFIPQGCQLAVLHGDPAKKDADVFFKVPGGFDIPEHWHTSAERMVLVKGQLEVSYQGEAPVTLKEGMYAYGPAKLPHKAHCASRGDCVLFIAFDAPVDAHPMDEKPGAGQGKAKGAGKAPKTGS